MPSVLVVDDEPAVRESLRMLLKKECDVETAGSVDAALEKVSGASEVTKSETILDSTHFCVFFGPISG